MRILESLLGYVTVVITTASPESFLQSLNQNGVSLQNVYFLDLLTVRLEVKRTDYGKVRLISNKAGAKIRIERKSGIYWSLKGLKKRPLLLLGVAAILLLTLLLPTRVLFVQVIGNDRLPAALIIEKAELCGISFGASRRSVRSEETKNQLLSVLPELRWAGVNTYGCVAVITVEEKMPVKENQKVEGIGHVIAQKDGIISEMTILRGTGLCSVGQAVRKGQVLVSGYIDHGISIEGVCADAEVWGYTGNVLHMVAPADRYMTIEKKAPKTNYRLIVGKKLINFGKDSGISGAECVRMYEERYLTLPGGFRLPIGLICETIIPRHITVYRNNCSDSYTWLDNAAEDYLRSQMLSGEILHSNTRTECNDSLCTLYGSYRCREIIGLMRSEEKMITDE